MSYAQFSADELAELYRNQAIDELRAIQLQRGHGLERCTVADGP